MAVGGSEGHITTVVNPLAFGARKIHCLARLILNANKEENYIARAQDGPQEVE